MILFELLAPRMLLLTPLLLLVSMEEEGEEEDEEEEKRRMNVSFHSQLEAGAVRNEDQRVHTARHLHSVSMSRK